ncbi:MAG: hypothetical protein HWQ38_37810 [Nostoc sp. NMS7]|uniref:hypothetical protein n=1 Tax=Nostoc sp. NMS7 TaxID=2815391 RepID=UPI0025FEC178|nr:hypothetical protein [Nostoc sp. NMS7]MBN3951914.1 hypothetical protein [Nostoc sp. NMS7]
MERSPPYKIDPSPVSGDVEFSRDRLIPESQLEAIVERLVKKKLAQMLGVNADAQHQRQWYDTEDAWDRLDLGNSEQLREMVRSGFLRFGIEVRDVRSPTSRTARYQFHIKKCGDRLSLPPEKRQGKK